MWTFILILLTGSLSAQVPTADLIVKPRRSGACFSENDLTSLRGLIAILPKTSPSIEVQVGKKVRAQCKQEMSDELAARGLQPDFKTVGTQVRFVLKAAFPPGSKEAQAAQDAAAQIAATDDASKSGEKNDATNADGTPKIDGPLNLPPEQLNAEAQALANKNKFDADGYEKLQPAETLVNADPAGAEKAGEGAVPYDPNDNPLNPKRPEPGPPWFVAWRASLASFSGTGLSTNSSGVLPLGLNLRIAVFQRSVLELDGLLPVALSSKTAKPMIGHGLIFRQLRPNIEWAAGGVFMRQFTNEDSLSSKQGSQLLDQLVAPEARIRGHYRAKRFRLQGDIGLMPTFNEEFKPSFSYLYDARFILPFGQTDSAFLGFHSESYTVAAVAGAEEAKISVDAFFLGYATVY